MFVAPPLLHCYLFARYIRVLEGWHPGNIPGFDADGLGGWFSVAMKWLGIRRGGLSHPPDSYDEIIFYANLSRQKVIYLLGWFSTHKSRQESFPDKRIKQKLTVGHNEKDNIRMALVKGGNFTIALCELPYPLTLS